jgi:hypothetical protein
MIDAEEAVAAKLAIVVGVAVVEVAEVGDVLCPEPSGL